MSERIHMPMNSGAEAASVNGRTSNRQRMLKSGIIAYSGRQVTLECIVRDLSETGAKLKMTGSVEPPATFELLIGLDGFEADCEVVWRKESELGVKFAGPVRRVAPTRHQSLALSVGNSKKSILRKPIAGLK